MLGAPHLTVSITPGRLMSDMELSLALAEMGVCIILGSEPVLEQRRAWHAGGLSSNGIVYLYPEKSGNAENPGALEHGLAIGRIPYLIL